MTTTQVPQCRFFHSGGTKSALNERWSKTATKKPSLRRAQSMPTDNPRKRRAFVGTDRSSMRRLTRQRSLCTSVRAGDSTVIEKRHPEKRRRLITIEEARNEVYNRYKLPSKCPKREMIDCENLESMLFSSRRDTALTIDGFDDDELAGLAFLDE
eukprot:CAMPEP_0119005300 /NCGR_PEP_ID=MMETSP1176-20130426/1633_1 /TAXON_ID=265551 /ORGANISM="Synedropsis recta cf, Strain CCMP1620" /LENGTH=154 /DNA_ID=CAMNT_0006957089 /DNA_START=164 /DNA_END=628 /DNA_ORIENTATION=-